MFGKKKGKVKLNMSFEDAIDKALNTPINKLPEFKKEKKDNQNQLDMDFIRVTIFEEVRPGVSEMNRERLSDYILPVSGIKSISPKITEPGRYIIALKQDYIPDDLEFRYGSAEAILPNRIVNILND